MFIDKVSITCKAGNGGDGAVAFRREKYVPNGGPSGGDGGRGGNVIFKATSNLTSLIDFRYKKVFKADNGEDGSSKNRFGKSAKDLTILVPVGTIIRNVATDKIIADLINVDEEVVILKGGNGGRGNAKFSTSTRQAPKFSEKGIKTKEFELILELKTIADIGLIGFPNVGKSSILASVSNAKPKIANYHFTTLNPNIGVVNFYNKSFVMADIPGLISGASEGIGLGLDFLKHIERTRLLIHVVDIAETESRDAYKDYLAINRELSKYGKNVEKLPQIIALNKCDLVEDTKRIEEFKKNIDKDTKIFVVSAAAHIGLEPLLEEVVNTLEKLPKIKKIEVEEKDIDSFDVNYFEVEVIDGKFHVKGGLIEEIMRGVVIDDYNSNAYFQKRLKDEGIINELKIKGIKPGDMVVLGELEMEYAD